MKKNIISLFLILLILGCAERKVTRIGTDEIKDLSGVWNDTDSRLVAEQMIQGVTQHPWAMEFTAEHNRKPVVIVGTIRNLSSEHIATDIFIKDVERELINSGKVTIVADREQREEVRDERSDQQTNASEETAKRLASEKGADFMLYGSIKTQIDALSDKEVKYYQVDLELINLENNEKVWIDAKKIKKFIEKSRVKW